MSWMGVTQGEGQVSTSRIGWFLQFWQLWQLLGKGAPTV